MLPQELLESASAGERYRSTRAHDAEGGTVQHPEGKAGGSVVTVWRMSEWGQRTRLLVLDGGYPSRRILPVGR